MDTNKDKNLFDKLKGTIKGGETPVVTPEQEQKPFDLATHLHRFETEVQIAIADQQEWVETHPEIIQYFTRKFKKPEDWFIYKGIKIAPHGASELIQDRLEEKLYQKRFGAQEGIIEGTHG